MKESFQYVNYGQSEGDNEPRYHLRKTKPMTIDDIQKLECYLLMSQSVEGKYSF